MPHILLIADEGAARADLRLKLAAHAGAIVVGEAGGLRAARALLADADYDLVFLDVHLGEDESFQLVPAVRAGASLVFVATQDHYAVRAFQNKAIDYLLKPVAPARLLETLRRATAAQATRKADPRGRPSKHSEGGGVFAASLPGPPGTTAEKATAEVALTRDERVYLRLCLESWEDSLPGTHLLRTKSTRLPRTIRYQRGTDPTQLFVVAAGGSRVRRWWRALWAPFA